MPNNIVYLAANTDRINECRYSLLKYLSVYNLKPPPGTSIIVHTERPEAFEAFTPFFQDLRLKEIGQSSLSKFDFIHQTLSSLEGNILFADCDSYFIAPTEHLFDEIQNGKILFYDQILVSDTSSQIQKLNERLSNNSIKVNDQKVPPPSKNLYTTEVLGLNKAASPLIKKMSDLYSQLPRPSGPIAEQYAFTHFALNEPTLSANNVVASYRFFPQFKNLLQFFFKKNEEESIPNLVKLVHHLDAQAILQDKKLFDSQPFVKKLFSLLSGKAWSVRQYQNKF